MIRSQRYLILILCYGVILSGLNKKSIQCNRSSHFPRLGLLWSRLCDKVRFTDQQGLPRRRCCPARLRAAAHQRCRRAACRPGAVRPTDQGMEGPLAGCEVRPPAAAGGQQWLLWPLAATRLIVDNSGSAVTPSSDFHGLGGAVIGWSSDCANGSLLSSCCR